MRKSCKLSLHFAPCQYRLEKCQKDEMRVVKKPLNLQGGAHFPRARSARYWPDNEPRPHRADCRRKQPRPRMSLEHAKRTEASWSLLGLMGSATPKVKGVKDTWSMSQRAAKNNWSRARVKRGLYGPIGLVTLTFLSGETFQRTHPKSLRKAVGLWLANIGRQSKDKAK